MVEPDQTGTRLDPRIKGELDKLNITSEEINCLEKELDDARHQFRVTLTESSYKLSEAAKRCGKSVKKAKPFHEARFKAKKAHDSVQEAAYSFQRAVGMFRAAKETIAIAEDTSMQGKKKRDFDSALQEMLNHATAKLNDAEQEKVRGDEQHQQLSNAYAKSQTKVDKLAKKLRKSIAKSAAYYDLWEAFYSRLGNLKDSVEKRQELLKQCKKRYRDALHNLERISEDIHRSRQLQLEASLTLQERSSGVGAESETEPTRNTDDDDDDEVFKPGNVSKVVKSKAPEEHTMQDKNANTTHEHGAVGGIDASRKSSSYSSSQEDGEPVPPILTEHGLPTLVRFKMNRQASDPDFYKPKHAIAKLPGIPPEEHDVIEATLRGYRSFDAELTEQEVIALRHTSPGARGADAPVIMIESPEGVVSNPQEESDEEELESYKPEEIEMSQFRNNEVSVGDEDENSVELMTFEQETQLNRAVDSNSSSETSEGDDDEIDEDISNSDGQKRIKESKLNMSEIATSDNNQEVADNGQASSEPKRQRARSMSFGYEQTLQDEDRFEKPDQLPSPIQEFKVSELERPRSPALFQYHAETHKHNVHEADDISAFTFKTILPKDDTASNGIEDERADEND